MIINEKDVTRCFNSINISLRYNASMASELSRFIEQELKRKGIDPDDDRRNLLGRESFRIEVCICWSKMDTSFIVCAGSRVLMLKKPRERRQRRRGISVLAVESFWRWS